MLARANRASRRAPVQARCLIKILEGRLVYYLALVEEDYEVHALVRKNSDAWRLRDCYDKINKHFVDLSEKEKLEDIND